MTIRFQLEYIHCSRCAKWIEEAIQKVQVDALVKVHVVGNIVEVDKIVDRAAIENAILGEGYSFVSVT